MAGINVWGTDYKGGSLEDTKNKSSGKAATISSALSNYLNQNKTQATADTQTSNAGTMATATTPTSTSATGVKPVGIAISPVVSNAIDAYNKDAAAKQNTAGTIGTGTSYAGTTGTSNTTYDKQMEIIKKAAQMSVQNQAAAIKNSLSQILNAYGTQKSSLEADYETDENQNEVERYKAQRALRESLANRGAVDSGMGRQEALNLSNAYSNRLNAIKQAYNTNLNDLRNNANASIADLENAANEAVADSNSQILSQLSDYVAQGYKPKQDYTVAQDESWQKYLDELRKQYGL